MDTLNNITINLPDITNTFDPTDDVDVMNTNDDTDATTVTGMNTNTVMRRSFDFETQLDEWESSGLMDDEEGKPFAQTRDIRSAMGCGKLSKGNHMIGFIQPIPSF